MSILFACDLDNTLIYSYKKKQDGFICVEFSKGREQGFMTAYTFSNFADMTEKVTFVPVTTRSAEQYRRITFPNGYVPEYALVSNGAVLIRSGETDENWDLIQKNSSLGLQLKEVFDRCCKDKRFINCRIVDDSYVFVYCAPDTNAEKAAEELAESADLNVELSGRKIYFFPENLSKGNAVIRLNELLQCGCIISAGDSSIDVSMLNIADKAVVPVDFDTSLITGGQIFRSDRLFSDFVVDFVRNL